MDQRSRPPRASAGLRLALALPLACAVLIGALWVGQSLRAYRAAAESPAPSEQPVSQAAARQLAQQPMQSIDLPGTVARTAGPPAANPDGSYLVGRTADFTQLAIVRVMADRDALTLRSELVASVPDASFVAWLPDGRSFIAQGSKIVNTGAAKAQMKTYDVFRVDLTGTKTKLGEALGGPFALSTDGKLLAAFDGDSRLVAIRADGSGQSVVNDPTAGSAPAFLGWDATGAIVRADYREPFSLRRIPLAGSATVVPVNGARSVSNARWSPDHKAAIVTATVTTSGGLCECGRLLTDRVLDMPNDALPAWIGPHTLLTRASDERAGTVDVLTGARTTLSAKMRSEKIRVIAVSLPYVMWLDEAKNVPHILDLAKDRETGVGLSPSPAGAQPLNNGRFLFWREQSLTVLDMSAWWALYVDAHPTPSPIPQSKDQGGVPAGFVRVESPEGGWSVVMPKTWYRRDAPLHGSELLSYDPQGMDFSGNLPPAGEARVVIELPNDYGATDLRAYARQFSAGPIGRTRDQGDTLVAGQPAYRQTFVSTQPPPWDTEQRIWFLRSPYFADRVVTIQATNIRVAEVDALVQSLRFFKPTPPPAATLTRAEVLAKYSKPTFSATRVDRVEAKLVRWKDYEKAYGGFRSGTNDPDELTWVVIVYGEIQPPNRGLAGRPTPAPGATPQTFHWELHAFPAVAGGVGGMYSCCGPDQSPPVWWDKLVDLDK